MPDVFSLAKRSEIMSRIRSRGNKGTELRLMALLKEFGFKGWRRHLQLRASCGTTNVLYVKPDFVFRTEKVAVFVDGCFFHGCPRHYTRPAQNVEYWDGKLALNRKRDRVVDRALRRSGWHVVRIWECDLRFGKRIERRLRRLLERAP